MCLSSRTVGGPLASILGETQVPVVYSGQSITLPRVVVRGNKPALLGRNWLSKIKLDWGTIFAVQNNAALDRVLTKYASIFSDEPGEIHGFEADVHISDDVHPIFKEAYQVPFAIQDRIKAHLEELTRVYFHP